MILCFYLLTGCTGSHALKKVLSRKDLSDQAYDQLRKEHPFDSIKTVAIHDTTVKPIQVPYAVHDTPHVNAAEKAAERTIVKRYNDAGKCDPQINDAFNQGVQYAIAEYSKIADTIINTHQTVVLNDQKLIRHLDGLHDTDTIKILQQQATIKKLWIWLIAILAFIVGGFLFKTLVLPKLKL